ncbi:hypothetical protein [Nocardioides sp. LML1-1-1.1]|uniref:hypothetical protein n=1 Tax=Nocardioides sp. LML1-1-1.1 TaxID=3135248 RepID=UPI003447EB0E
MTHDYQPPPHRSPRFHGWPDVEYDAALHLLDRQVVDVAGRQVAKVDDLELTLDADGRLVPTGLLVGLPALLPRFGPRLGALLARTHDQVYDAQANRSRPDVVDLGLVHDVSSEVHLSVPRTGLLRPREDVDPAPERWRLGTLLGLPVAASRETGIVARSRLLDVRLRPTGDGRRHVVGALVVGPGRPGALLGYDRHDHPSPWLVARLVRWLHRHACLVEMGPAVDIDRDTGEVRIGREASCRPLLG